MPPVSPAALKDAPDLATLVDAGWDVHDRQPQDLAEALMDRAAGLARDAAGTRAIGLAEHLWLAHLHDAVGLRGFLQAVSATAPGGEADAAWRRAHWAADAAQARQAGGPGGAAAAAVADGAAPPPPPQRWQALGNVWTMRREQGHAAEVLAELPAEVAAAGAHPVAADRRPLAAACHNQAVQIRTAPARSADEAALMLAAAQASKELWASAGTWLHVERADYQLARCHALLGDGPAALRHAQACVQAVLDHADDPQADALERFFALECRAWAHRAAGDAAGQQADRAAMAQALAWVDDPAMRAWAQEALDELDGADAAPTLTQA